MDCVGIQVGELCCVSVVQFCMGEEEEGLGEREEGEPFARILLWAAD